MDSSDRQKAAPLLSFLDNCYSGQALLGEKGWTSKPRQQGCNVWLKVHSQKVYGYRDCVKEMSDFIHTCMHGSVYVLHIHIKWMTGNGEPYGRWVGGVCCAINFFLSPTLIMSDPFISLWLKYALGFILVISYLYKDFSGNILIVSQMFFWCPPFQLFIYLFVYLYI